MVNKKVILIGAALCFVGMLLFLITKDIRRAWISALIGVVGVFFYYHKYVKGTEK